MEDISALAPNVFGITFQKACVTAAVHGCIPHLVRSMRMSGSPRMTESMIQFVAADCIGLWGIMCLQRSRCFHCGRKTEQGVLCECVEGCMPRDFIAGFKRADVLLLGAHDLAEPAQTFLCGECGQLGCTTLGEVLRATEHGRTFRPHTRCGRCQRARWQGRDKVHKARQAARAVQGVGDAPHASHGWGETAQDAWQAQGPS